MISDGRNAEVRALLVSVFFGFAVNLLTAETGGWWGSLQPLARYPWLWVPASIGLWAGYVWLGRRPGSPRWKSGNPYPGLSPFREDRATVFFGRESETAHVQARLDRSGRTARQRFIPIVGPSGTGKSSLIYAGLIPKLRAEWSVLGPMIPGADPLTVLSGQLGMPDKAALAADPPSVGMTGLPVPAIKHDRRKAVLIVDQLEDIFTLASDDEAQSFVAALQMLLDKESSLHIVVALRPEFLGAAAALSPSLFERPEPIGPLAPRQVREAIEKPALAAGVRFEDGLVDVMVAEATVGDSLPLLGLLLQRLFRETEHGIVRHIAYENAGRVSGAITEQADEVVRYLDFSRGEIERTLIRFIGNEQGEVVRRKVRRSDLDKTEAAVVEAFREARLMVDVDGGDALQLTHDAIIRQWDMLAELALENRDKLRHLAMLEQRATDWSGFRNQYDLLRGDTLRQAEATVVGLPVSLGLRRFLDESRKVEDSANVILADRAAIAAQDIHVTDPQLALSVAAVAARELYPSKIARMTMWGFTTIAEKRRLRLGHRTPASSSIRRKNGSFRTADLTGLVCTWNASGELIEEFNLREDSPFRRVQVSPTGDYVAAGDDRAVRIFDCASRKLLSSFEYSALYGGSDIQWIGPDKVAIFESPLLVWMLGESRPRRLERVRLGREYVASGSPDGRFLAIAGGRGIDLYEIVDVNHPRRLVTVDTPQVVNINWSPSSDRILAVCRVAQGDTLVKIVDSAGQGLAEWSTKHIQGCLWYSEGRHVQEVRDNGARILRDSATGRELGAEAVGAGFLMHRLATTGSGRSAPLAAPENWPDVPFPPSGDVSSVSWSRTGERVALSSPASPVRVAAVGTGPVFLHNSPRPLSFSVRGVVKWSPDGALIAGVDGRKVVVWDAAGGERLDVLDVDAEGGEVSWSPDSHQIAAARKGFAGYRNVPAVLIYDVIARKISYEVPAPAGLHGLVTWAPDGLSFASILGEDLIVFAAETGAARLRWPLGRDSFRFLSWSPDGTAIAVGAGDALTVHAYPSGETTAVTGRGVEHLDFDPAGRRIVCLFSTGEVEIWDSGLQQRYAVLREPGTRSARGLHWSEDIVVVTRDGMVLRWRLPPESGPVSEPSGTRPLSAIERLKFGLPAIGIS